MKIVDLMNEKIFQDHLKIQGEIFAAHCSGEDEARDITGNVDRKLSRAIIVDRKVVGSYCVAPGKPPEGPIMLLEGKCLTGIGFAMKEAYRGRGFGRLLKNAVYGSAKKEGYDFIWGGHVKSLNNIEHWKKTREVFLETSDSYWTFQKL